MLKFFFADFPAARTAFVFRPFGTAEISSKAYLTGESINDDIISKEIIPMIKKVAKKNKLPVIDLHSAMDGMPELFPDHIHPNEEGAKVMAKAVYDAIAK